MPLDDDEPLVVSTPTTAKLCPLVVALAGAAALHRPLLLSSVAPELAEVQGVGMTGIDLLFLLLVALVTTMAVPVVGTLLMFTLMVGPPAAARSVVKSPLGAIGLRRVDQAAPALAQT